MSILSMVLTAAQEKTTSGGGGLQQMILMFGLIAFFMWLIVLRPQKRERQERERKLSSIKKGDRVVTIGGLHGKVLGVDEGRDVLSVEVAPKVAVKFNRSAIASVDTKDAKEAGDKPGGETKAEG